MRLDYEFTVDNNKYQSPQPLSADGVRVFGELNTPGEEARLIYVYNKLEKINLALTDPKTTEHQAIEILRKYHDLMGDNEIIKILNSSDSETARKATEINNEIKEYLIRRDMITFGYFVDKMDTVAKYSYNIGFKYHRESMNNYMSFFKTLSADILNSYGEYTAGTVDDGKKIKVGHNKFMFNLHRNYMACYPAKRNLMSDRNTSSALYQGRFEIVIGENKNDCSIYVDGVLIDSGVSYDYAYKKMDFFFAALKKPASGTQALKNINAETENNKVSKIIGTVDIILLPESLLKRLNIYVSNEDIASINSYYDKEMITLQDFDALDGDRISKQYDDSMDNAYNIFDKRLGESYYKKNLGKEDDIWTITNGELNSYNTLIDGVKKESQMILDELSQKFNTINSNYDNILKVITTMISELTQELKGFLRF